MYKLVLDRMVGIKFLHKKVAIVCAGNLETDNAIVQPMSTAMQTRLIHFELALDHMEWLNWFMQYGGDHRISDYIKFKPGSLYTFQPDHTDSTYACPRTWVFADRILDVVEDNDPTLLPLLSGALSEGVAREFLTFCKIYEKLPKIEAIQASPDKAAVPSEPSYLYALTGSVAQNTNKKNLGSMIKYIKRMPAEFQIITLREIVKRNKEMMATTEIQEWISTTAIDIF